MNRQPLTSNLEVAARALIDAVREFPPVSTYYTATIKTRLVVALEDALESISGGEDRSPCSSPQGSGQTVIAAEAVGITAAAPSRDQGEIDLLRIALKRIEMRSHTMSDADDEQALFDIGEIANKALSDDGSPGETTANRAITLNGYQLKAALEFVAPDNDADQFETEVSIQWADEKTGHSGAGYYCCLTEYPEEGSIPLDEMPPDGAVMAGIPSDAEGDGT